MRRGVKIAAAVVMLAVIAALAFIKYLPTSSGFDPQGRYDPKVLNDVGVIYANRSDIRTFGEGWSTSNSCPWGFVHNGIDFFFKNDSKVLATAPGQVERIELRDNGASTENRYTIILGIRFNATVVVMYGFEPWTNHTADRNQQLAMFKVSNGTWVAKGDVIATFLMLQGAAHIHFGVTQDYTWRDPTLYMSSSTIVELLAMEHTYEPTWNLSYP